MKLLATLYLNKNFLLLISDWNLQHFCFKAPKPHFSSLWTAIKFCLWVWLIKLWERVFFCKLKWDDIFFVYCSLYCHPFPIEWVFSYLQETILNSKCPFKLRYWYTKMQLKILPQLYFLSKPMSAGVMNAINNIK